MTPPSRLELRLLFLLVLRQAGDPPSLRLVGGSFGAFGEVVDEGDEGRGPENGGLGGVETEGQAPLARRLEVEVVAADAVEVDARHRRHRQPSQGPRRQRQPPPGRRPGHKGIVAPSRLRHENWDAVGLGRTLEAKLHPAAADAAFDLVGPRPEDQPAHALIPRQLQLGAVFDRQRLGPHAAARFYPWHPRVFDGCSLFHLQ
eukprot:CAMPEP_0197425738 /NCGR_PEP_ID=MMETSP1170-20131217/32085_1 /TAXON_ID=54406 /ORGANISM="Sarcinochrysis sp, Strain CCMP770" /LENGTH=201 /DNA_ID=CAMNT_0042953321 /DNA_START=168 /DNA_END=770 /DNA_ORIENTATION=-